MRFVVGLLLLLVACGSGASTDPAPPTAAPAPGAAANAITFHEHVTPILQKVCQNCHVAGGIAPFPLVAYEHARDMASSIVAQTKSRRMPPWGAQNTAECSPPLPWKDDIRLTDAEIATLDAWHAGGDLEGNPADAPPPRAAPPPVMEGALSIAPPPFALTATKDTMQCFVLDPKLTTRRFLNATHFVPSNPTIVHHALAFAVAPGAKLPNDADPTKPYECFGGPLVDGANLVAAWAPGAAPSQYPPRSALAVEPGTRFVMQVHYHPHANASAAPDATTFHYRLVDEVPEWAVITRLAGNFRKAVGADPALPPGVGLLPGTADPPEGPAFLIPPGVNGHVETMTFTLPMTIPEVRIAGVGAHMHLAGRDEKLTLVRRSRPTEEQCLLHEPAWNFDWQRGYQYDAPIESLPTAQGGDRIDIRCTYDNTMQNRKLGAALLEASFNQPQPIALGEQTTDEMCLGAFVFLYRAR